MRPQEALLQLLQAVGEREGLDIDLEEYLVNVLDPENIDESTIDLVQPLLSSVSTAFGEASAEQQTSLLLELLQKVSFALLVGFLMFCP
jgi:hypothetical protein